MAFTVAGIGGPRVGPREEVIPAYRAAADQELLPSVLAQAGPIRAPTVAGLPTLAEPLPPRARKEPDERLPEAIRLAQASTITIETTDAKGEGRRGAGVAVRRGYATAPAHMVDRSRPIYYAGRDANGQRILGRATIVGVSRAFDIAVLKLEDERIPPARFSRQRPRLGDTVIVTGSPMGFDDSATVGIVSGVHRDLVDPMCDCFQTDGAANPGNSGGATFNIDGDVTGQIIGIYAGQNISFATQAATIERLFERLTHGDFEPAALPFDFGTLSLAEAYKSGTRYLDGATITVLNAGSPAARAGLRVGDRIVAVDDQQVVSAAQVRTMLSLVDTGRGYRLRVMRGTQALDFTLTR